MDILTAEGYVGSGIDVRARASWAIYPERTRKRLFVASLDPLELFPDDDNDNDEVDVKEGDCSHEGKKSNHNLDNSSSNLTSIDESDSQASANDNIALIRKYLRRGTFLIANHADELSPWTPILATLAHASGYLSIPCCAWSLDARFVRAQLLTTLESSEAVEAEEDTNLSMNAKSQTRSTIPFAFGPPPSARSFSAFVEALRLGADVQLGLLNNNSNTADGGGSKKGNVGVGGSAYAAYRAWLACLGTYCGWGAPVQAPRSSASLGPAIDTSGMTSINTDANAIMGELCTGNSAEESRYNASATVQSASSSPSSPQFEKHSKQDHPISALLETPECDVLRIPSTRNWALVGRAHASGTNAELQKVYMERARALLRAVRGRGLFRTRRPEGKAGAEH